MKIRKLPSGSYTTQVQINKKRKSFTARTKNEVRRMAMEYALASSVAPSAPLGVLVDNYIDSKRNVLSPSTVERYERIRKQYFDRLMNVPADQITADRLQSEVNLMAVRYAPKTVRTAYGLISSTLKTYSISFDIKLPAKRRIEYHLPIEDEVYIMIDKASENLKTAILLAAFCGLRRGEIVALTSDDIAGDTIHVNKCAVYDSDGQVVIKRPKTYHSDRYVILPDIVKSEIAGKTGRLCPVVPSTITADFIRLRNRLGLRCRFHDLRHFFASFCHSLNFPDQYIQKQGGWKSDFMLKEVYRNTLDDVEKQLSDQYNKRLNERKSANEVQTKAL